MFDAAAMGLRGREHGMRRRLHHQCIARVMSTRSIRLPRTCCIHSGWLSHYQIDNTTAINDTANLLLTLVELSTIHGFANLPLSELLIGLFLRRTQITIIHP